jgi:glycerophosphoryl diester phosphodiesterase
MTLISAHCSATVPLAAYEAAARTAELVEFDVRRCADGTLVCHHDRSAGPGGPPLRTLTYRRLCELTGVAVPTCEEVMSMLAGTARAQIDLKEAGYEDRLVAMADATLGRDGYVVTTLIDRSVAVLRAAGARTALSLKWDPRPWRRLAACGATGVAIHRRLARDQALRRYAARGLDVLVWTINDDAGLARYVNHPRVTVVITDRPAAAAALRD